MPMPVDEDITTPQTMAVRVVNHNTFMMEDRFDGTLYQFPPDRPVQLPIDAAHHIFGWFPAWTDQDGREHKPDERAVRLHVQRRFGWNTPGMEVQADIFFEHISIQPVVYRLVPVTQEEETEADVEQLMQTKPLSPRAMQEQPRKPRSNKVMEAAAYAAAQRPQT